MAYKYKHILKHYLRGWLFASIIWELLRNTDLKIQGVVSNQAAIFMISWLFQGLFYGFLYVLINHYLNRKIRFIQLLIASLTLQIIVAFGIIILIYPILKYVVEDFSLSLLELIQLPSIPLSFLFALIINFLISLTIEINLILGKGTLLNIIRGKYYTPKIEQRIFMFLDFKGSTSIAEKLGHVTFSNLIQDCFFDLSVVDKYKAEVYKYVGDEAILVWNVEEGKKSINCINAFFAFREQLEYRADYYQKKYNTVPTFKAGIHIGEVTVAEVGELKREIAYLGDPVNTTARIEGECNRLKSDFLISETLLKQLKIATNIKTELKGNILLRGKEEEINIYSIKQT